MAKNERSSRLRVAPFRSFLTIAAYGWYARHPDWKRYLAVISAFALALMSKPMAVSIPPIMLLLDYWPLNRREDLPFLRKWTRLLLEKVPLILMSAGGSVVTIVAQKKGGAMADFSVLPLSERLANATVSYVAYIGKALFPAKLSVFYPHPEQSLASSDVIAAAVILVAITAGVFYLRNVRYLVVGWLLFFIALIPVIGILQVGRQGMADRYAYVPSIGLFIVIVWGLGDLMGSMNLPALVPIAGGLFLALSYAVVTSRYLECWQNGVTLFTRAALVAGRPDPAIEEGLADALLYAGKYQEAYPHYGNACALRPGYALCHFNMAEILFHDHQLHDALDQYRLAGSFTEDSGMAASCLVNSGDILLQLGDYNAAGRSLEAALQIDPRNKTALQLQQRLAALTGAQNR